VKSRNTKTIVKCGLASLLSFSIGLAVLAGPVSFQQAVSDYNAGKYSLALSEFESYKSAYPNYAQVHYYLALCHQSLNHVDKARAEYQWVAERASGSLKPLAAAGLAGLSKSVGHSAAGGTATNAAYSTSSNTTTRTTASSSSRGTSSASTSSSSTTSDVITPLPDCESYLADLVNKDRQKNGASPSLRVSAALSQLAREHAIDMVKNKYFDHFDKKGMGNIDRAHAAGITATVHENISQSFDAGKTAKELTAVCEAQMIGEPPNQHNHRANILGAFKTIGVGVVQSNGRIMLDQEFCDEDI
jgi:uncharacterized protein YkwD